MSVLRIESLTHVFGSQTVLDDITLEVGSGEFVAVVGPSGSGKSTLLSLIAGLAPLQRGMITVDGRPVEGPGPDRTLVFQEDSLFPWRTARANVEFALLSRRASRKMRREQADAALAIVGLEGSGDLYPRQLSGGMRQRCALARALVTSPRLILLDEPFASLDWQSRQQLQDELEKVTTAQQQTALFVTHDIDEAIYLSDRVVVVSARPGRVVDIVGVELERPRHQWMRTSGEIVECRRRILEGLGFTDWTRSPVPDL